MRISDDAMKLLVNASDGSGPAYSGYGASIRSLPDDNPAETLYQSDNPTAADWTGDEQWVVVSETFIGESGYLDYYRTSASSQPVEQVPTWNYVMPGSLAVVPDGSLVFTAENPSYSDGDTTLHVYPGPAAGGSPAPPSPTPSETASPSSAPTASASASVDNEAPTASLRPVPRVLLNSAYGVTWTASDSGSGVADVDVRYRFAPYNGSYGSWRSAGQGVTAKTVRLNVLPGREYCLEVRARDKAGNVSAWSSQRCLATPVDDHKLAGSGWTRLSSAGYYERTYSSTKHAGSTLTLPDVVARQVAVVASVGQQGGKAAVYLDGKYLGRITLTANHWQNEHVIALPAGAQLRGTLRIRSLTSGRIVRIDGVAFLR
jgi:hypothetical protein